MIAYGDAPEINIFNFVNNEYHLSGSLFFKTEEFDEVIKLMSEGKLNLEPYSKLIENGFKPLPTWQDAINRYNIDINLLRYTGRKIFQRKVSLR